jgi:hypothetical protein
MNQAAKIQIQSLELLPHRSDHSLNHHFHNFPSALPLSQASKNLHTFQLESTMYPDHLYLQAEESATSRPLPALHRMISLHRLSLDQTLG